MTLGKKSRAKKDKTKGNYRIVRKESDFVPEGTDRKSAKEGSKGELVMTAVICCCDDCETCDWS